MNVTILLTFLAFTGIFCLTAATARDKRFLLPASGFLILAAGFLLISGSLTYQTGTDTIVTNVSTDTTFHNQTEVYTDFNNDIQTDPEPTTYMALIMLAIAIYMAALGAFNTEGLRGRFKDQR